MRKTTITRSFWSIVLLISIIALGTSQTATTSAGNPATPTAGAGSFAKFGDIPINLYTGTANIGIPIYSVSDGPLSHSVSINYHSAGNKVSEVASPIGLGWHLNAGGVITRSIVGIADDSEDGYIEVGNDIQFNSTWAEDAAEYNKDSAPDIYHFSMGGYAGKFVIKKDTSIQTIPESDIQIDVVLKVCGLIYGFKAVTPDGTQYYFGYDPENLSGKNTCSTSDNTIRTNANINLDSWYLERMVSFDDKHSIDFEYTISNYKYKQLEPCLVMARWDGGSQEEEDVCDGDTYDLEVRTRVISSITGATTTMTFDTMHRKDVYKSNFDLHEYFDSDTLFPHGINEIRIEEGDDFEMRYHLYQSYFTDNTVSDEMGKRLKLDSIQLISISESSKSEPPYRFEYYHSSGFFPNYLSKRIDHWGFYNSIDSNDYDDDLIPYTEIEASTETLTYGSSNRESYKTAMENGMLKKITYPTHGNSLFTYEANTIYRSTGSPQNPLDLETCSASCGGVNSAYQNLTINQDMLDNGVMTVYLTVFDDDGTTGYDTSDNYVVVEVWDLVGDSVVWAKTTSDNQNAIIEYDMYDDISWKPGGGQGIVHLQSGTQYKFRIESKNARGDLFVNYTSTSSGYNDEVGGLRIATIRTHDNIDSDNDIIRTYKYTDPNYSTRSSGILFNEPAYGFHMEDDKVLFKSYSILPLSGFEGYHIGYERVIEEHNGNGEIEYIFFDEINPDSLYDEYPIPPDQARVVAGNLKEQNTYNESDNLLRSQTITRKSDNYEIIPGSYFVAEDLRGFIDTDLDDDIPYHPYDIRTNVFRPLKITSTLDGLSSEQTYSYGSGHLAPTKTSTTNSDDKDIDQVSKYTRNYDLNSEVGDSLIARNIKTIPYLTQYVVDGDTLDGSQITYKLFNNNGDTSSTPTPLHPRPFKTDRFERTWDETTLQAGAWEKQSTVNSYTTDGLPYSVQQNHWDPILYTYTNKLVAISSFSNRVTTYTYHTGSRLLDKKTLPDGTSMSYDYDGLMRLTSVTDDCTNAVTSTEYHYSESPGTKSYIRTKQDFSSDTASNSLVDTLVTFTFLDGLNRDIQTIRSKQVHGTQKDIVLTKEYDDQGRIKKVYEPQERIGATTYMDIVGTWKFSTSAYESSPLNRITSSTPIDWYATTYSYGANLTSDSVYIDGTTSIYEDSTLIKKTVTDPNGNKSIVFTDKKGRTILSRRANSTSTKKNDVYSIYDDKDRLITTLPAGGGLGDTALIYEYSYDGADNLISKKVPDKEEILYKYNDRDLLSLQQDGNLKAQSKWYAFRYNVLGKELVSGFYTGSIPTEPFASVNPTDTLSHNLYGYGGIDTDRIKTEKIKILGTDDWLTTDYTYDDCGRISQAVSNNSLILDEKLDTVSFSYDGAGNLTRTEMSHYSPYDTIHFTQRYKLDHVGRTDEHYFTLDTLDEYQLSSFDYNHKDQLITKKIGKTSSGFLQTLDYTYKTNGLLNAINEASLPGGDLFFTQLKYDSSYTDTSPTVRKNGDIINTVWKNINENERVYSYSYDYLNRLTAGTYLERTGSSTVNSGDYDTRYTYDQRGNIDTLSRKGLYGDIGNLQKASIDSLEYSYYANSNRLKNISEDVVTGSASEGYHKSSTSDYTYDKNGNLINDPQKNLQISYNHLDLVDTIKITGSSHLVFTYDAAGNLLQRKSISSEGSTLGLKDYLGNIEYTDTSKVVIYHAEGRVHNLGGVKEQMYVQDTLYGDSTFTARELHISSFIRQAESGEDTTNIEFIGEEAVNFLSPFGTDNDTLVTVTVSFDTFDLAGWKHEFIIPDHLGNTRLVFSDLDEDGSIDSSEILQKFQFYPFGLKQNGSWITDNTSKVSYQYNGIEYLDDLDLNMATFRVLDPSIGRWLQTDPAGEAIPGFSSYQHAGNSPILYADKEGDFIPQLVGAIVGGTVNVIDQALKGNITSLGEGFAYFGTGAAAGVAVSFGQVGLARGITVGGNKITQAVTGKFRFSDLDSPGDFGMLALDIGTDLLSPGLTQVISKPLTKALTPLAANVAKNTPGAFATTVSGGGNIVKTGGSLGNIAFSAGFTDEFVVSASRIAGNNLAKQGYRSFYAFKQAFGSAGKGQAWHHIVEQHANNVARFGSENIHNINNLVKLPHGKGMLHQRVTGHYNSYLPNTRIKVRDYIKTLSFDEQLKYGATKLREFGFKGVLPKGY